MLQTKRKSAEKVSKYVIFVPIAKLGLKGLNAAEYVTRAYIISLVRYIYWNYMYDIN